MKKVKILIDRKPLSKSYVQSKQNFGQVLSQFKNLKPPVWKTPWFYGPVGLAVVALSVTVVNSRLPDETKKPLRLEAILPLEQRKIEAETLAFISPKEEYTSIREIVPEKNEPAKETPKNQDEIEEGDIDVPVPKIILEVIAPVADVEMDKRKPLTRFPSINRIYSGEITVSELCSNGIECLDSEVTSFTLEYYNGREEVVEDITGNSLNKVICESISKYNINEMIFITKIRAVNETGQKLSYPSMNLIPVKNKY